MPIVLDSIKGRAMSKVFVIKSKAVQSIAATIFLAFAAVSSAWSEEEKPSPWIMTPLVSSDPKLSTSIGGLVAYLHKFDEESPASMFGAKATLSNSDSFVVGAFGQIFFDHDNQRALVALVKGTIHNDYDNYLGSGMPLKTTDDLDFKVAQYSYRFYGDWFIGAQGVSSNYKIYLTEDISQSAFNETNVAVENNELIELGGYKSNALGFLVEFDDRDKPRSATSGQFLKLSNAAYREALGGDVSFDAYLLKYATYLSHGNGNVFAISSDGRWTNDAPIAGYSSVQTKGYTRGQFLAPHMLDIQVDERIRLANDWGMVLYAAVACLYGDTDDDSLSCTDSDNIYPSVSLGVTYTLKEKEGIVIRSEIAKGKGSSQGFYMSFGHPF
jgi:hypothetical protein